MAANKFLGMCQQSLVANLFANLYLRVQWTRMWSFKPSDIRSKEKISHTNLIINSTQCQNMFVLLQTTHHMCI